MTQTTPHTERRRTPRRQPALGTVFQLVDLPLNVPDRETVALVWNISLGGVSFLFPHPIQTGTQLHGRLMSKRDGGKSVEVQVRVTHSVALQTGDFLMGCQFENPITPEQMSYFVDEALIGL